jgi:hypothetical protein
MLDQRARETGFYYTTLNATAAASLDQRARETGFYYTTLNLAR